MPGLPSSVAARTTTQLLPDGRVLIAGGQNSSGSALSSAEVFEPAPEAETAGGEFGAQAVGEPSATQTLVVTNIGAQALQITGATLGGANPGDFAITRDSSAGRGLAFEQSCILAFVRDATERLPRSLGAVNP